MKPINAFGIVISIQHAYMFPYLRKVVSDSGVIENSGGKSIAIRVLFTFLAIIPAVVINIIFAIF